VHHDRDVNAAINLRNLAVSSTGSAVAVPWRCACGETGADLACKCKVKLVSAKQESNGKKT
jgi:putative transposase